MFPPTKSNIAVVLTIIMLICVVAQSKACSSNSEKYQVQTGIVEYQNQYKR